MTEEDVAKYKLVKYQPISVRKLLTEIKNITELMVDLAYSAVLFNDKDLAEEVIELEERVDYLKTMLLMNLSIAIRSKDDAEDTVGIMRVASAADRISDAAGDIARLVPLGLGVDPYVVGTLTKVGERLVRTKILPNSILKGKTIKKLGLGTRIGVDIIAISRREEFIINPRGDVLLNEGDVIIARGSDVGTLELDKLAKAELTKVPKPKMG